MKSDLSYKGMQLLKTKYKSIVSTAAQRTSDGVKSVTGTRLLRRIKLIEFIQNPYNDSQLQRFEASARRNWAVKSGISVREFFTFSKGSELIFDLPESKKEGLTPQELETELESTKKEFTKWKKARENISKLDDSLKLVEQLPVFYWQNMIFGRGLILKILEPTAGNTEDSMENEVIKRLQVMNTRRLGDPILDADNDMSFEGIFIDGQPLDKSSCIYGAYQPVQISPHTEWFGYAPLEPIIHLAEGLNIFWEEDVKEIQRSAWLASILLEINTAGLTRTQAQARIRSVIKEIKAGKYIGINQMGITATQLKLESDYNGLGEIAEKQESKIFKALQVPQFLVQSEDIANRATADKSAELFLNGVISKDHKWLENILEAQWYEPLLRKELELDDDKPLPFRIRREFNLPRVSEFVDMADAIVKLISANVWDKQKANEVLDSEEVTERVNKDDLENKDLIPEGTEPTTTTDKAFEKELQPNPKEEK